MSVLYCVWRCVNNVLNDHMSISYCIWQYQYCTVYVISILYCILQYANIVLYMTISILYRMWQYVSIVLYMTTSILYCIVIYRLSFLASTAVGLVGNVITTLESTGSGKQKLSDKVNTPIFESTTLDQHPSHYEGRWPTRSLFTNVH
jgi:hypothetical protein